MVPFYWGDTKEGFTFYEPQIEAYCLIGGATNVVYVPLEDLISDQSWEAILGQIKQRLPPDGSTGIVLSNPMVSKGEDDTIWRTVSVGFINHPVQYTFADATAAVRDIGGPDGISPAGWFRLGKFEDLLLVLRNPCEAKIIQGWSERPGHMGTIKEKPSEVRAVLVEPPIRIVP